VVTSTRARLEIRELTRKGRFVITEYCALRLLQRFISEADVRRVLVGASACWPQANGRWKLAGEDGDGEGLFLIVELLSGVVVVTAFRGDQDEDDES
jgi:hypothetical protein